MSTIDTIITSLQYTAFTLKAQALPTVDSTPTTCTQDQLIHTNPTNMPPHSPEAAAQAAHAHIFSQPTTEPYRNNPWALYRALDEYSQTRHLMNFKETKLRVAKQHLESMQPKPKTVIEFGTYVGCSAIAWAAILRDLHGPSADNDIHIYTFEVSESIAQVARDFIELVGLQEVVHVLVGPASESLRGLVEQGKIAPGGVDMAFFDHWEKFYLSDLQLCEELALFHVGSKVIADNTDIPGAPDYLEYVRAGGKGGEGEVRYTTRSFETEHVVQGRPNIVEVTDVVAVRS
ncbi:putative O-methyltransferase [Aspergillus brunneoviolaceus CBS 621.78]|uniref:Uncharacterized protein n=1 Tax=Aspergillus brunneoviolaceus CBS 621.78 TaxID=1450534 RepID=A0ACD1GK34_9EURO|nr:hypothetical protein BO95DRAFT_460081 [Aspergillus brunneoviolaceus CBS 621.78]RAH49694.1 hypothetical protein BO95DRAFT_460081 [Aspergillus brunneoviolaceus CBS 621.78]